MWARCNNWAKRKWRREWNFYWKCRLHLIDLLKLNSCLLLPDSWDWVTLYFDSKSNAVFCLWVTRDHHSWPAAWQAFKNLVRLRLRMRILVRYYLLSLSFPNGGYEEPPNASIVIRLKRIMLQRKCNHALLWSRTNSDILITQLKFTRKQYYSRMSRFTSQFSEKTWGRYLLTGFGTVIYSAQLNRKCIQQLLVTQGNRLCGDAFKRRNRKGYFCNDREWIN